MPSSAPRFQAWIAEKLRPLFGGKVSVTKPLTDVPPHDVKRVRRAMRAQFDALAHTLEHAPDDRKAEIIAAGGWDAYQARALVRHGELTTLVAEHKAPAELVRIAGVSADQAGRWLTVQAAEAAELATLAPIALQAAPAPEMSLDGLFDLWVRVKAPKITRKHKSTLGLFKAYMGANIDFRRVTRKDCRGFCDHLTQTGHTGIGAVKHMDALRGMFSAAVARDFIDANPAAGIKPDGDVKRGRGVPFTGPELVTILDKAAATKFGGKRHDAVLWLLRLAVWTGCRINELAQLRKDDVGVESGVARIWVREGEGQSVKTGDDRKVPLHPSIADAFLAYAKASTGEFIFDCFPNGEKGRAAWLICNFPSFRRDVCGITRPKVVLHSMRHRFKDACTNAGVSEERCRAMMGHSAGDVHSRYGQGAGLKQLAADVARLEPLAD